MYSKLNVHPVLLRMGLIGLGIVVLSVAIVLKTSYPLGQVSQLSLQQADESKASTISATRVELKTDSKAIYPIQDIPKPGYLQPITSKTLGVFDQYTKITRIVGNPGEIIPGMPGVPWGNDVRHHYSIDQPWNADQSLLLVFNRGTCSGCPNKLFLDGENYSPRFGLNKFDFPASDIRWHPTLPNILVYAYKNKLAYYDVTTSHHTILRTFSEYKSTVDDGIMIGPSKGNITHDGTWIALAARRVDGSGIDMFAFNLVTKRKMPVMDYGPESIIDDTSIPNSWVSMAASGKYVVIKHSSGEIKVYDREMRYLRTLEALGHMDLTYRNKSTGPMEDWAVGQNRDPKYGNNGVIVRIGLNDGRIIKLSDYNTGSYAHHVSCRNNLRQGWCYASYLPNQDRFAFSDEVMAIKLFTDDQGRAGSVERYAQMHNKHIDDFRTEAHGVPSRDGKRIMWSSNWLLDPLNQKDVEGETRPIQSYVVDSR